MTIMREAEFLLAIYHPGNGKRPVMVLDLGDLSGMDQYLGKEEDYLIFYPATGSETIYGTLGQKASAVAATDSLAVLADAGLCVVCRRTPERSRFSRCRSLSCEGC